MYGIICIIKPLASVIFAISLSNMKHSFIQLYHIQVILQSIFMIIFICSSNSKDAIISDENEVESEEEETAELQKEEAKGIAWKLFCFKYKKYIRIFSFL